MSEWHFPDQSRQASLWLYLVCLWPKEVKLRPNHIPKPVSVDLHMLEQDTLRAVATMPQGSLVVVLPQGIVLLYLAKSMELIHLCEGLCFRDMKKLEIWVLLPLQHEAQGRSGQETQSQPSLLCYPFSRFAAVQVKTAWLLLSSRTPMLGTRPSVTRQLESSRGCMVVKNMDRRTSCSASGLWSDVIPKASSVLKSAASQKVRVPGLLSRWVYFLSVFGSGQYRWPLWWEDPVPFVADGLQLQCCLINFSLLFEEFPS